MTTEESTILANLLTLGNKVLSNDSAVEDTVNAINAVTVSTTNYDNLIKENVQGMIDKTTIENKAVTAKIINSLVSLVPVKDAILGILDAKTLDFADQAAVKLFIDSALASSIDDFNYYSLVAKLAIFAGDKTRIASAITKIESLGA